MFISWMGLVDVYCGEVERTTKTLLKFFKSFGEERSSNLRFVMSDMWQPYLKAIKKKAVNALNILDRFHIMKKFNEAIDQIRRQEAKKLAEQDREHVLINGRWLLLKKVTGLLQEVNCLLVQLKV